jgi:hypothetical protein
MEITARLPDPTGVGFVDFELPVSGKKIETFVSTSGDVINCLLSDMKDLETLCLKKRKKVERALKRQTEAAKATEAPKKRLINAFDKVIAKAEPIISLITHKLQVDIFKLVTDLFSGQIERLKEGSTKLKTFSLKEVAPAFAELSKKVSTHVTNVVKAFGTSFDNYDAIKNADVMSLISNLVMHMGSLESYIRVYAPKFAPAKAEGSETTPSTQPRVAKANLLA